jgi:hypothetical protein
VHQDECNSTLVASRPVTHGFARKLHGWSYILVLFPSSAFFEVGLSGSRKFSPLGTNVEMSECFPEGCGVASVGAPEERDIHCDEMMFAYDSCDGGLLLFVELMSAAIFWFSSAG